MSISLLSDEWCRLAHKFLYRSPWHVHPIVLTNQLSRFLTKRYISVANAIRCDLQWCGRMKTVEKYWKIQTIIYEFTKFTRASLYAKLSNWQDFNEVNEFCDVFWQIYLSLYLSLDSFYIFFPFLFLFAVALAFFLTRILLPQPRTHPYGFMFEKKLSNFKHSIVLHRIWFYWNFHPNKSIHTFQTNKSILFLHHKPYTNSVAIWSLRNNVFKNQK